MVTISWFQNMCIKWRGCTFTVFHEDQDLPDAVRHCIDCRVQVADNVLMAWQLFLHSGWKDWTYKEMIQTIPSKAEPPLAQSYRTGKRKKEIQHSFWGNYKGYTSTVYTFFENSCLNFDAAFVLDLFCSGSVLFSVQYKRSYGKKGWDHAFLHVYTSSMSNNE